MKAALKVLKGSKTGVIIPIQRKEFVIGRGDDVHLKPRSDAISRRHCAFRIDGDTLTVRDLKSKNGTYVNDEVIDHETELQRGDRVRIGPLEFEVLVERKVVAAEAKSGDDSGASVTEESGQGSSDPFGDSSITRWLDEDDDAQARSGDPETRQFKFDETDRVRLEQAAEKGQSDEKGKKRWWARGEKKELGKLPKNLADETKDTHEAAEKMLKKFFNRQ